MITTQTTTKKDWDRTRYWFGWCYPWSAPKWVCVYKYDVFMRISNVWENGKKSSNGPPFGSFSREKLKFLISCQNDQRVETIIFCKLNHFWVVLWTKIFFPFQIHNFENGVIVKISKSSVLRRCPSYFGGGASTPRLKWDRPKTYKCWRYPHFQNS